MKNIIMRNFNNTAIVTMNDSRRRIYTIHIFPTTSKEREAKGGINKSMVFCLNCGLTNTKIVFTTLEMNAYLTLLDGTPLSDATLYRQLVGRLISLSHCDST